MCKIYVILKIYVQVGVSWAVTRVLGELWLNVISVDAKPIPLLLFVVAGFVQVEFH